MSIKTNFNVQVEINPQANQKPENGEVPTWEDNKFVLKKSQFEYYEFELTSQQSLGYAEVNVITIDFGTQGQLPNPGTYLINLHTTVDFGMPHSLNPFDPNDYKSANFGARLFLKKFSTSDAFLETLGTVDYAAFSDEDAEMGDPLLSHTYSITSVGTFTSGQLLRLTGILRPDIRGEDVNYTGKCLDGSWTKITLLRVA